MPWYAEVKQLSESIYGNLKAILDKLEVGEILDEPVTGELLDLSV